MADPLLPDFDDIDFLAPDVCIDAEPTDAIGDDCAYPVSSKLGVEAVCSREDLERLRNIFEKSDFKPGLKVINELQERLAKQKNPQERSCSSEKNVSILLPNNNKLGREPKLVKGRERRSDPITDGMGYTGITTNKGSFCWTVKDAVMFNLCQYNYKFAFVCMVMAWCRRTERRNYFKDCRLSVKVCADTLGLSTAEYLKLRGWSLHYKEGRPIAEYRKLRQLLLESGPNGKFVELCAMIIRCVCQVQSDPMMDRRLKVEQARTIRDRITRHTHAFHTAAFAFGESLFMLVPEYCDDRLGESFYNKLEDIFGECHNRKALIKACHLLLCAFTSPENVLRLDSRHKLKQCISTSPKTFLSTVDDDIAPLHADHSPGLHKYLRWLLSKLREVFLTRKVPLSRASKSDFLLIVRFKVHHEYFIGNPSAMPTYWPTAAAPDPPPQNPYLRPFQEIQKTRTVQVNQLPANLKLHH